MPTYDYQCSECGHAFELFQSMRDPVKRTCPKCGRRTLVRLIGTGAAVLFKGGGFYETDYRSESYRKAAEAEKKSTAEKKGDAKEKGPSSAADSGATNPSAAEKPKKPKKTRTQSTEDSAN